MHPIFPLIAYNHIIGVIALIQSDPGAVRVKAPRERGRSSPLHCASALGHVEICRYLLDHGAEVDSRASDGCTPLHYSCQVGHVEVTRLLLSRGADVAAVDNRLDTPLHVAALFGNSDCVAALLKYRPDIHMKNDIGFTALDVACQSGAKKSVMLLCDRGAKLSYTIDGFTAIHRAANNNHHEIVEMLVKRYNWDVNTVSKLFIIIFQKK